MIQRSVYSSPYLFVRVFRLFYSSYHNDRHEMGQTSSDLAISRLSWIFQHFFQTTPPHFSTSTDIIISPIHQSSFQNFLSILSALARLSWIFQHFFQTTPPHFSTSTDIIISPIHQSSFQNFLSILSALARLSWIFQHFFQTTPPHFSTSTGMVMDNED